MTNSTADRDITILSAKMREEIVVVPRDLFFGAEGSWYGLKKTQFQTYIQRVEDHKEFHPRGFMEEDHGFKQIIPYLVFTHDNKYFLMQRKEKASETRLAGKMTLGIGGHIRASDLTDGNIFNWARREFYEEVRYHGSCSVEPLGILNDDSNDVGKVHVAFVLLVRGSSSDISIKSELQEGYMATREECLARKEYMEGWSQLVLEALV